MRDFQEINYPSCGVGVPARRVYRTGKMPIPQEKVGYFFIWKSLSRNKLLAKIPVDASFEQPKSFGLQQYNRC